MSKHQSRRKFIKQTAYVAPAVLSLSALPAMATYGSPGGSKPGTGSPPGTGSVPGTGSIPGTGSSPGSVID